MEWHAARERPRATRTAGSSRCRRTPRPTPAMTGAPGTCPVDGLAWRSDVGFEELQGRSWRGNPMQAHPERPEDHQTQSPYGTYKERCRPIRALKNEAKGNPADQGRDPRQRVIAAEPAPMTPTSRGCHERAFGTLRQSGDDAH